MKDRISKILTFIGTWFLTIIGISCTDTSCDVLRCEYGCPYSDFVLKGVVTDSESKPIKGIQVKLQWVNSETGEAYDRTEAVLTDENGLVNYHDSYSMIFDEENQVVLLEDIDGAENGGEFESKTVVAKIVKTGEGDGNWKEGDYECTFKAQLDLKQAAE